MSKKIQIKPWVTAVVICVVGALMFVLTDHMYNFMTRSESATYVGVAIAYCVCCAVILFFANLLKKNCTKNFLIHVTFAYTFFCVIVTLWFPFFAHFTLDAKYAVIASIMLYVNYSLASLVLLYAFVLALLQKNKKIWAPIIAVTMAFMIATLVCWNTFDVSVTTLFDHGEWELNAPEYEGARISKKYNCGVLQTDEFHGLTGEETYMQVASLTNEKEFLAYCDKLTDAGYELTQEGKTEASHSKTYTKDGKLLHVYYSYALKETRIIEDPVSATSAEFSYSYTPQSTDTTGIYQYALLYDDNCSKKYGDMGAIERCGMNYIIKLADNSLIVIDGGATFQSSDSAAEGFWALCKELSGVQTGEKVRIACWICTHGHGDHMVLFSKVLWLHHEEMQLERILYNFPYHDTIGTPSSAAWNMYQRIRQFAPDVIRVKPHTGETYTLANAKMEILYTHEDNYNAFYGKTNIYNYNDSSTLIKFTFGNRTFMLLGDMDKTEESRVAEYYTQATLKSDIVQVAHHGFNVLYKIYPLVDAEYAFYPQATENATGKLDNCTSTYQEVTKYTAEDKVFFIDKKTYGILFDNNGNITIDEQDYIGPDGDLGEYYDGSPV